MRFQMIKQLQNIYYRKKYKDAKFNFLIVGAQKCGTTSLHAALNFHPQIFLTAPIKEPGYFLPFAVMQKYYAEKNILLKDKSYFFENLLLQGYRGEALFGEASTFYTSKEWSNAALAEKIYQYNPNIKLIYIIRNKLDRILSHYYLELNKNSTLDIEIFLQNPEVFGICAYYERIKPFLKYFSNNILVLRFENLIAEHNKELKKVYRFLGVSDNFELKNFPKKNSNKQEITEKKIRNLKEKILINSYYQAQDEPDDKLSMYIT